MSVEPTDPRSAGESSSDSEPDTIEQLKAEQREVMADAANGSEVNGNQENGKEEAASADVEVIEIDDTEESTDPSPDGSDENGDAASTSVPIEEEARKKDEGASEVTVASSEIEQDDDGDVMEITEEPNGKSEDTANGTVTEEVLDEEEPEPSVNGTTEIATEKEPEDSSMPVEQNGKGVKRPVECIELDDDDDDEIQEISTPAPAKKAKIDDVKATSVPEEDNNEQAQKRLLDKLEEYVKEQKDQPSSKSRKVLDTLLGAINAQVQKEPLSVRKLILDKVLVLPNTISFPPSQVCDLLIEHDPEMPLTKVINRMFGEERPKLSDSEKRERAQLKQHNPVPNMTKLLVDIGQDLVQEATYCDIVHAKNLPEVPKNLETYKQVAAQLKPVWETLKRKNEPYKLKMHRCDVCGFQTESKLVMSTHKENLHFTGSKFQCTMCKETDTSEQRMKDHYFETHLVIAKSEEKESKYPCAICEEDFNFKGVREQHYKQCKKDYIRIRNIMMPKQDDHLYINRWLWERPQLDPSILQQQQQAALQQAQQKKQQQLLHQQQAAQAAAAAQLLRKQQLQQQQQQQQARLREQQQAAQFRQVAQLLQQQSAQAQRAQQNQGNVNHNTLIAAMQASLRRGGQQGNSLAVSQLLQKQMAALKSQQGAQQLQAAVNSMRSQNSQKTPTHRSSKLVTTPSHATVGSSSAPTFVCEICDASVQEKEKYLQHLQTTHKQMVGKVLQDMSQGAPLACSRCRDRFWTYEGLERHLVMSHGLVTADLLLKAQKKEDGGRCKTCGKNYAFNMLQHLVADHQVKLCSAEIMYSCDVCAFKCSSYQTLEAHLTSNHPKGDKKTSTPAKKDDCITLDD